MKWWSGILVLAAFAPTLLLASCFSQFAHLTADGSPPEDLIVETYQRLFEELGTGRLTTQELQSLSHSGDPFSLPADLRPGTESLGKRLREFRSLISERGWLTSSVLARLKGWLVSRSEGLRAGALALAERERSERAIRFSFEPGESGVAVSPDGKWAIHVPDSKNEKLTGVIVNLHTGDILPMEGPAELQKRRYGGFKFSADGSSVRFIVDGGQLAEVPFAEGSFNWQKLNYRGSMPFLLYNHHRNDQFSADGKFISGRLVSNDYPGRPFLKRTEEGRAYLFKLPDDLPGWRREDWTVTESGKVLVRWAKSGEKENVYGTGPRLFDLFDLDLKRTWWSKKWVLVNPVRVAVVPGSSVPLKKLAWAHLSPNGDLWTVAGMKVQRWKTAEAPEVEFEFDVAKRDGPWIVSGETVVGSELIYQVNKPYDRFHPVRYEVWKLNLKTGEQKFLMDAPIHTQRTLVIADPPKRVRIIFIGSDRVEFRSIEIE